ncbi:MAG TPA: hypothetical protein V6C52_05785 [Coleofasciculaceae cyanobacterium]|jgi:hypothetical protein
MQVLRFGQFRGDSLAIKNLRACVPEASLYETQLDLLDIDVDIDSEGERDTFHFVKNNEELPENSPNRSVGLGWFSVQKTSGASGQEMKASQNLYQTEFLKGVVSTLLSAINRDGSIGTMENSDVYQSKSVNLNKVIERRPIVGSGPGCSE